MAAPSTRASSVNAISTGTANGASFSGSVTGTKLLVWSSLTNTSLVGGIPPCEPGGHKRRPGARRDGVAGGSHEVEQLRQVVVAQQPRAEHLLRAEQMAEVRAAELRADGAAALRVERRLVADERGVADVQLARAGNGAPVAPAARRIHAVEHVDARVDGHQQIGNRADAHEVARPVLGQQTGGETRHPVAVLSRLADGKAADRATVEVEGRERGGARRPQRLVEPALDDAEQ